MSIVGDAAKDRMGPRLAHAVPSDLRNLERTAVESCRKAHHAARDDAEATRVVLLAAIQQHLDPDADAEERLAGADDVVAQHLVESERAQVFHRRARRADAGQDHAVGGAHALGAVGDLAGMAEMLQRACDAGQIARLVIDDCDHRVTGSCS